MSLKSFSDFLSFEKKYSSNTILAYSKDVEKFQHFLLKCFDISDLKKAHYSEIRRWITVLVDSGLTNRSVNRKISSLRSYYNFLIKTGSIRYSPLVKHKALKENKKIYVPFSEQEINDVLKSFNGNDFETIRDRLIIELLYCTGMRRNELINVKIKDIDFIQERIKVLGKRKKERYIPLVGPLKKSLNNYIYYRKQLKIIKDSELLFLTTKGAKLYGAIVYRIVKIYFQIVSSKVKKSPHILRHSFATHLLKNGADLNAVKELLGHSSLAATQIYTNNNISELKKIYKNTHPRQSKIR